MAKSAPTHRPPDRLDQRITLEGILFILFSFAIGFAAYNTGNALLYLILSLMLSFLGISGFLALQTLSRLTTRREAPPRVHALTPTPITLRVANGKRWLASYSLRMADHLADGALLGGTYLLMLEARAAEGAIYMATFPRRGVQRLGRCIIRTRFPFGFFERSLTVALDEEILVLPRVRTFRKPPEGALRQLGEEPSSLAGEGIDLRSMRDYTPHDPARNIHWKASARTGRLIAKETEREASRRFEFFLNNAHPSPGDPIVIEAFERAIEFCASLAMHLARRGVPVRLHTRSGRVTPGNTPAELDRLMRALALLPLLPEAEAPLPASLRQASRVALQIGYASGERRLASSYLAPEEWAPLLDEPVTAPIDSSATVPLSAAA